MPKKCMWRAKATSSVPRVGSSYDSHRDSQSSSSSSLSTCSSISAIKQLKKAQIAEMKAQEADRRNGQPTKALPKHLESHMLPFFYPDDYEYEPSEDSSGVEVPRHLVSHVTATCQPVTGTADQDAESPRSINRRHLESHVTRYCYPVSCTADDEDVFSPRPDVVPPHLESHVASYCQPVNDDGAIIEWPTDTSADESVHPPPAQPQRTDYDPRHLRSQLDSNYESQNKFHTGISCQMTRDHPNMRDNLFPDDDDWKPFKRVGGRRAVVGKFNLFEESKPKTRPLSITIVQREPENTKENIFGSESTTSTSSRRRWENDTKQTIFGGDANADETPAATAWRSRRYEDTTEKLFGETYGINEAQDEHARRRRPLRTDTQANLFGSSSTDVKLQRPQSARSFTATYENLFGQLPQPHNSRRVLRRENTFDNLFGETQQRSTAQGADERFTTKNPKILQASLLSVKCGHRSFVNCQHETCHVFAGL